MGTTFDGRSCFPACGSGGNVDTLRDLGYNPAEGEEEAEFINAQRASLPTCGSCIAYFSTRGIT